MIAFRESRDPFADHDEDCSGQQCWDYQGMIPRAELIEVDFFDCQACADEWELLGDIVEKCGDISFYHRAMAGFQLAELFERYGWTPDQVDAESFHDLMVVRAEQARYEIQQMRSVAAKQHTE